MGATIPPGRRVSVGSALRLGQGILRTKDHDHTGNPGSGGPIANTGAPTDAEYIVGAAHASLTAERIVTNTPTVSWDLSVAGQAKANVTTGGGGGSIGRPNNPLTTAFDYEDFLGNDGTTGSIGKLGWGFVNSSVAFVASEASHPGIISKLQNNNSGSLYLGFTTGIFMLLPSMNFDNYFIVRPQSFDGNCSLWVGYQDTNSGTGDANNMILFEALSTDTNWFTTTRNGGTVARQNTTIPATTGNWYTFRLRRIDASTLGFTVVTVNGVASGVGEFTETTEIPTTTLGWAMRMRSHTAANRTCEIDYWDQLITGMAR